jgi:RHS repeat-associated protein
VTYDPGYSPLHFTGQEYDADAGSDHFLFRQYGYAQGRWMSPDPAGQAAVNLSNPQSWNRYSYTQSEPINRIDPLGLWVWSSGNCYFDTVASFVDVGNGPEFAGYGTNFLGCVEPATAAGAGGGVGPLESEPECISPRRLTSYERAMLRASQFWASASGKTIGFGLGASGSINPLTGVPAPSMNAGTGGGISNMLVTDTSGNSALVTTYTQIGLNFANKGGAIQGGLQFSYGNQQLTPGWSGSLSGSISGGPGLGGTVSEDSNGTTTFNAGLGLGAKVSGGLSELNASYAQLICKE